MPLTDDEYTCLLIMEGGENLIWMKGTRWYKPLGDMYARDLVKPIGNENYVITQKGQHALIEHNQDIDAKLRHLINCQGEIQANRKAVHHKMGLAIEALVDAAHIASKTTNESIITTLEKVGRKVLARALERVK